MHQLKRESTLVEKEMVIYKHKSKHIIICSRVFKRPVSENMFSLDHFAHYVFLEALPKEKVKHIPVKHGSGVVFP